MADVKISALPAATTPLAGTEVLPIVQSSTTKKVAISDVTAGRAISASSLTLTTPLAVANGGTGLTSLTAGRIPFGAGTSAFGSDSNLFWDNTNKRLGIGTTSPGLELSVAGSIQSNAWVGRTNISAPNADCAIYRAADNTLGFSTASTQRMSIDAAGNIGLGVTPSAWGTYKVIQIGAEGTGFFGKITGGTFAGFISNGYWNGTKWVANNSGTAGRYEIDGNAHKWYSAAYTSFGADLTFTQAMTLDASGNLLLGTTSAAYSGMNLGAGKSVALANDSAFIISDAAGTGNGQLTVTSGNNFQFLTPSASGSLQFTVRNNSGSCQFLTNSTERMRIDASGNVVINTAAIATTATDGFLYVPTCAGTPTGTPTTYTGRAPIVVNTTNNKLYFYSGGAWRDAGP